MAFGRSRHSECDQEQGADAHRRAQRSLPIGDGVDQRGRHEPAGPEQRIAPDHRQEHEGRGRKREHWHHQREPSRAPRHHRGDDAEPQPVQRGDQQKHAGRARRQRIDQPPEDGHQRRLPVAEVPVLDVTVNERCVVGQVAGIEQQHREPEPRRRHQRHHWHVAWPCRRERLRLDEWLGRHHGVG